MQKFSFVETYFIVELSNIKWSKGAAPAPVPAPTPAPAPAPAPALGKIVLIKFTFFIHFSLPHMVR